MNDSVPGQSNFSNSSSFSKPGIATVTADSDSWTQDIIFYEVEEYSLPIYQTKAQFAD